MITNPLRVSELECGTEYDATPPTLETHKIMENTTDDSIKVILVVVENECGPSQLTWGTKKGPKINKTGKVNVLYFIHLGPKDKIEAALRGFHVSGLPSEDTGEEKKKRGKKYFRYQILGIEW